MATVNGLTAEEMGEIRDKAIVSASVNPQGFLILTQHDGTQINAGYVQGSSTPESIEATPNTLVRRTNAGTSKFSAPTEDQHPATKLYSDAQAESTLTEAKNYADSQDVDRIKQAVPTGVVHAFAGSVAPTGFLICNGAQISRSEYPDLFSVIGTTYGAGDGSTTFNLPNLKGRVPVGLDSTQTEFDTLGETGGEKNHVLTSGEMPTHTHTFSATTSSDAHTHTFSATTSSDAHSHTFSDTTSSNGGHAHNTVASQVRGNGSYDLPVASGTGKSFTLDIQTSSAGTHTHTVGGTTSSDSHTHTVSGTTGSDSHSHTVSGTSGSSGSGSAHNNLQPYLVMRFIIKT